MTYANHRWKQAENTKVHLLDVVAVTALGLAVIGQGLAAKLTADASFIEVKDLVDSYVKMNEATPNASGTNTPKTTDESNVKAERNTTYAEDILTNLGQQEAEECPICMDVMQSPVLVPGCMHQRYVYDIMRVQHYC